MGITAMARSDEAPRFRDARGGHVESWFLRANHPTEPKAVWLKTTVLRPRSGRDEVAEAWCALFDGGSQRTWAAKATVPLGAAAFGSSDSLDATVGECRMRSGLGGGSASGALRDSRSSVTWDLAFASVPDLSEPLCPYPSRRLVDGRFPKFKLLTPIPVMKATGTVRWDDAVWDLSGWIGMHGHNWGREHGREYAWGQCVFTDRNGDPSVWAEGFSGRVRMAGVTTPFVSGLVVRRGGETWRFDRLVDLWNQSARVDDMSWTLRIRGTDGDAVLSMRADPALVACLGYRDPDGSLAYCQNSKLAEVVLRVNPAGREGFEVRSRHGGALEFLRRTPDPRFPNPV
jgi:hypothetical protein